MCFQLNLLASAFDEESLTKRSWHNRRGREEADLIEITMEEISPKFKGIELSVIYPDKSKQDAMQKIKSSFANILLGNRQGMTIIGPASIVKKIEKNPDKIELFTNDLSNNRYRKKKKKK